MAKANIMIVEDEGIVGEELKISLEDMDYTVTSIIKSGEQAIEKADQDCPDLILMDIRLKGQMDGIEAAELIRSRLGIAVVFLTAYADDDKLERAKLTMPFGYILKPFQDRDLKVVIEIALYTAKIDAERKQAGEALKQTTEELSKEHNQRIMLSKRLIDLLEKDRQHIAVELHDHIGQTLISLKMHLELIHEKLKPDRTGLGTQIKVVQEIAIQVIKDIKNISHGLRPTMIDTLGLVSSLRQLFDEIRQQTDMKIRFFSKGIPKRFDKEKELAIYRIVQESLSNILKHAQAKEVFVNLIKKDENLILSVEDDGIGFDQDKVMKPSKGKRPFGLLIMRERAVQLDGEFTIESQAGKGTHVLVEIPL